MSHCTEFDIVKEISANQVNVNTNSFFVNFNCLIREN